MKVRKGFTLVELLIVMAIIAALMAVLVPVAGGAMKKAKATRIGVVIRNVEQAAEQYIMAYLPDDGAGINVDTLVDKGYLNDNDILDNIALTVTIDPAQYEIRVNYTNPSEDPDLMDMIEATLKETYADISKTNQSITITSTGTRFW